MKIDKNVLTIVTIVAVSAVTLPFIINSGYGLIINFIPGTMYIDSPGVWVGFYGGFLGASITLIGIYWQISQEENNRHIGMINNTHAVLTLLYEEARELESRALYLSTSLDDGIQIIINEKHNRETIHSYIEKSLPEEKVGLILNEGMLCDISVAFGKSEEKNGNYIQPVKDKVTIKALDTVTRSFAKKIKNKKNSFEKKYGKHLNLEQKENSTINI